MEGRPDYTVIYSGKSSMKYIDGQNRLVMPIVGSDGLNFGVGVIVDNQPYTLWGTAGTTKEMLRKYYKAMRFLEEMEFLVLLRKISYEAHDITTALESAEKKPHPRILSQIGLQRYKDILAEEPADLEEAYKKIPKEFACEE